MTETKKFYIYTFILLSIFFNAVYIWYGAIEGYGIPNLIEIVFASIAALFPTGIYMIFKDK